MGGGRLFPVRFRPQGSGRKRGGGVLRGQKKDHMEGGVGRVSDTHKESGTGGRREEKLSLGLDVYVAPNLGGGGTLWPHVGKKNFQGTVDPLTSIWQWAPKVEKKKNKKNWGQVGIENGGQKTRGHVKKAGFSLISGGAENSVGKKVFLGRGTTNLCEKSGRGSLR